MIAEYWYNSGNQVFEETFMSGVCADNSSSLLRSVFNSTTGLVNQVYAVTAGADAVCAYFLPCLPSPR